MDIPFIKVNKRFADNHALDKFYLNFENQFRGSQDEIREKMIFYAEILKRAGVDYGSHQIIDVGCGRGELLSVLKQYGFRAVGVDLNKAMVDEAKKNGLRAKNADAIKYIGSQLSGRIGAVTGIHIIEHLPFEQLILLFSSCFRALAKGGLIIFETPNPENLNVGTYSFLMDPSHIAPLPPPLVRYALESIGFKDIEILYRNPGKKESKVYKDPMLQELYNKMYGPLDYAVVAYKR